MIFFQLASKMAKFFGTGAANQWLVLVAKLNELLPHLLLEWASPIVANPEKRTTALP